jgi:hypothetical protein
MSEGSIDSFLVEVEMKYVNDETCLWKKKIFNSKKKTLSSSGGGGKY